MRKVGIIGLGAMGAPMARNLARAGLLQGIWNRTFDKARELAQALEVPAAATPVELARQCDVIMLCVSADRDLLEVVDALADGLQPGSVVVDHSTVGVDTARRAAEQVAGCGGEFLDAPVSGGVEGARAGTLAIMAGGSETALNKARPALEAIGGLIQHMGPVGSGQATKAVNQILCAGINQAVTEALAFGQSQGLNLDRVIEVVSRGAAGNWFLEKRGPTMIRNTFHPGFKLALHHKDLQICRQMAEQADVNLPLTARTIADYERLMAEGHGDEDISALFRLKQ